MTHDVHVSDDRLMKALQSDRPQLFLKHQKFLVQEQVWKLQTGGVIMPQERRTIRHPNNALNGQWTECS